MKLYQLLIFIALLALQGCKPGTDEVEFSPKNTLRDIIVIGEILPCRNDTVYSLMFEQPLFYNNSMSSENIDTKNNKYSFSTRNNIIQNYQYRFNGRFYQFAAIPKDTLHLNLQCDENGQDYTIQSSDNFVQKTANFYASIWDLYGKKYQEYDINNITDADSLMKITAMASELIRSELPEDGIVLDKEEKKYYNLLIDQFVDNEMKAANLLFPLRLHTGLQRPGNIDSIFEAFNFDDSKTLVEDDIPVYENNYLEQVHNRIPRISSLTNAVATNFDRVEEKIDRGFEYSMSYINENYAGLTRDMLIANRFGMYANISNQPNSLLGAMETFIEQSEYPAIREFVLNKYTLISEDSDVSTLEIDTIVDILKFIAADTEEDEITVVDIWAVWCKPCLVELNGAYPTFTEEFENKKVNFVFLAQNSNSEIWKPYTDKLPFDAKHYLLNKKQSLTLNKQLSVTGIPHHAILDHDGNILESKCPGPSSGLRDFIYKHVK